jgi:hypothetical protein
MLLQENISSKKVQKLHFFEELSSGIEVRQEE